MTTTILKEGVLNDDLLYTPDDGKVFNGNYIGIVEHYTFANEWSNHKHVKRFRSQEALDKFVSKWGTK